MVFSCKDIKKSFGVSVILDGVSFIIEEGEKAAIIGVNGAGKTTLMRIISGEMQADSGELMYKKRIRLGYMSQVKDLSDDNTIYSELLSVFAELIKTETELRNIEHEMSGISGEALEQIMEKYSKLQHWFEDMNGYEFRSRIRGVIKGLGFSEEEYETPIQHLSGGQKTRVSLGKLLLSQPELLLLDEPTNHLDMDSVAWLEDVFLKSYQGSVLIISHDRYFLDKTATKIIEIENKKSKVYNGSYTYYAYKKEVDREIELKQFVQQQREIQRQEEMIKMWRIQGSIKTLRRAESREKLLSKVERLERPPDDPDKMRFVLEPRITSGNDVLHVEGLSKKFDEVLFKDVNFDIQRGEAVALIGANGIGKTTIFKILNKKLSPNSGFFRLGSNVGVGYYDQEQNLLNEDKTIFDEIATLNPQMKNLEIRNLLAAFMFTGDDVFKPISALSGGERGRVSLCKIMMSAANFIMLDEPTNHLDMFSKEILEEAIRSYTGTILFISHDRYFINNTADRILELTADGIKNYVGDYDYYIERKAWEQQQKTQQESEQKIESDAKSDWMQKKTSEQQDRKRLTQISKTENEIADCESKIQDLLVEMEKPEVYTDHHKAVAVMQKKDALESRLLELYDLWNELVE